MGLISREAIKKYISALCTYVEGRRIFYEEDLDLMGSAFDGMTNGEVIKALFPNADYCGGAHFMHITNVNSIGEISFPWEWWNAPYKAESEDKE
jgi:hypothetical protein